MAGTVSLLDLVVVAKAYAVGRALHLALNTNYTCNLVAYALHRYVCLVGSYQIATK